MNGATKWFITLCAALAFVPGTIAANDPGKRGVRGEVTAIEERVRTSDGEIDRVTVQCDRGASYRLELAAGDAARQVSVGDRVWARVESGSANGETYRVRAMRNETRGTGEAPGQGDRARQRLRDGSCGGAQRGRAGEAGRGYGPGAGGGAGGANCPRR